MDSQNRIEDFPIEIITIIVNKLDPKYIVNFVSTCRKLWSQRSRIEILGGYPVNWFPGYILRQIIIDSNEEGIEIDFRERLTNAKAVKISTSETYSLENMDIFKNCKKIYLERCVVSSLNLPPKLSCLILDDVILKNSSAIRFPETLRSLDLRKVKWEDELEGKLEFTATIFELPRYLELLSIRYTFIFFSKIPQNLKKIHLDQNVEFLEEKFPDSLNEITILCHLLDDVIISRMKCKGEEERIKKALNVKSLKTFRLSSIISKFKTLDLRTHEKYNSIFIVRKLGQAIDDIYLPNYVMKLTYHGETSYLRIPDQFKVRHLILVGESKMITIMNLPKFSLPSAILSGIRTLTLRKINLDNITLPSSLRELRMEGCRIANSLIIQPGLVFLEMKTPMFRENIDKIIIPSSVKTTVISPILVNEGWNDILQRE
jgi:hypothetical protein